jgi:hypothetical protein
MASTTERRAGLRIAAAIASFLLVSLFVVQSSQAAFSATATNQGNGFEVVTIGLDSDVIVPLFSYLDTSTPVTDSSAMVPGEHRDACLVLTYSGGTDDLTPISIAATAATTDVAGVSDQFTVAYDVRPADDTCSAGFGTAEDSWTADSAYGPTGTAWTPSTTDDTASVHVRVTLADTLSDTAAMGATVDDVDLTFSVSTTTP